MFFVFRNSYVPYIYIYVMNILCMIHTYPYLVMVQLQHVIKTSWKDGIKIIIYIQHFVDKSFVHTQLIVQVLFQTIQFSISIRCYHSRPEWIWEWWQWKGTPYSPNLQHLFLVRKWTFSHLLATGFLQNMLKPTKPFRDNHSSQVEKVFFRY